MPVEVPLPKNEAARLEALRTFGILDTPPERIFDDLTRLTSYICGTPIAFIGFMDADRLWFKSRIGWDASEIPREMSFCAHTILQSDVLVESDTLADQGRLALCPLATHGGIRFYAGAPLMSSEGYALGTLCVMDSIPRGLSGGQTDALRLLARQVISLVESRRPAVGPLISAHSPLLDAGFSESRAKVQGFSFWRDISEQKRAHDALRHSEQRLHGIIGSAMDAIITVDHSQRIVVFNSAAEEIFRCNASQALGLSIDKFIPERFRAAHRRHIENFAKTGVTARSLHSSPTLFAVRADGEEFPIEATISQVESEGEQLFTVILRDIGARLQMEAELRQAQKMEAIGQLAGGIAHEFNNFLGVILGYSELLSEEAAQNEKLAQYVTEIRGATQHAASLTRQLLAFGRKQVLDPQMLDLNRCIWESHNLLRRLVPANIDVVPVLAPAIGRVKADVSQIQQVLINLVANARDAMPLGGKIAIETTDAQLDETHTARHIGLHPGSYVQLSIRDNGAGMNEETRAHIFEPFYTTKEPGKGTGLGLATVYGIVTQSGGHVSVESTVGKGTVFRIYLPRIEPVAEETAVAEPRNVEQTGPATVLVVEDETVLRRLISFSLEKRNLRVLAARDGWEALEIFRQHAARIRLVVTDLIMPHMDGLELKKQILASRPNMKFLFISGYAEPMMEENRDLLQGCAFLEKPFLPEELALKVNRLLAGDAAA